MAGTGTRLLTALTAAVVAAAAFVAGPQAASAWTVDPVATITPAAGCHDLVPGFNGVKVKIVQRRLGMAASTWETMDATTVSKVRAFQSTRALRKDGVVDRATWQALGIPEDFCMDRYQARPTVSVDASDAERVEAFVGAARSYLGDEYVWGGAGSEGYGVDCSGLVLQALYAAGIDPQPISVDLHVQPTYRTSQALFAHPGFAHVPLSQVRRGDLVFYTKNSTGLINHVAIALGGGQLIEARDTDVHVAPLVRSLSSQTIVQTAVRPFASRPSLPTGAWDSSTATLTGTTVAGWAKDPDTTAAIDVHAYVDGAWAGSFAAGAARGDVGAHGFRAALPLTAGTHRLCLFLIDQGRGSVNPLLGCRTVSRAVDPRGSTDSAQAVPGGVRVQGWALDPDTVDPVRAHVYLTDPAGTAVARSVAADLSRPDVAAVHPAWGDRHGFSVTTAVPAGRYTACAYGINVGAGANALLGCRAVTSLGSAPLGSLDTATATAGAGAVTVSGWALDPDVDAALRVHVYVDGTGRLSTSADGDRPDVRWAYPAWSAARGFSGTVTGLAAGTHRVCAYAINQGAGTGNPSLGCRDVLVG